MICFSNGHAELSRTGQKITLKVTQDVPVGWHDDDDWNAAARQNYAASYGEPLPGTVTVTMGPKEAEYLIGALMSVAENARHDVRCPVCHGPFTDNYRVYPSADDFIETCSDRCADEVEHRVRAFGEYAQRTRSTRMRQARARRRKL